MYTQHFGLEKPVFDGGIAQNDDLFLGPRQQRVAANLKIGLTTRDSVVTLTGTLGVGKTTIAAQALRITSTRLAQTWVGNTPLAPDEMLELLLAGFELAPYDMGRVQRLQTWRQHVSELSATDTRVCILVENALVLGPKGLQALEALTAADPNDCPGANLILMGPANLHELLDAPELAPLKQRIRSNQRLDPMTPEEVEQYLRHRVAYAGGDYDKIFALDTAAMIHCFSAGVPRVINNVCETALIVAATRKQTQLGPQIVKRVAEGVYGLAASGPLPETAVAASAAAAAAAERQPAETPAQPAVAETAPAEQPAPEPPADPAPAADAQGPVDAQISADDVQPPSDSGEAPVAASDAEPQQAPAVPQTAPSEMHAPEPPSDPVPLDAELSADDAVAPANNGETPVVDAAPEPQAAVNSSNAPSAAERASAVPVLTDEVDFELPVDNESAAAEAQPPAASAAPQAPAEPNEAPQVEESKADEQFNDDIAAATHLHEISDEMAELLFSEEQAQLSGSDPDAAAPLDSSDLELTPERTAVVLQVEEDAAPLSEEDQDDAGAQAAPTVVF